MASIDPVRAEQLVRDLRTASSPRRASCGVHRCDRGGHRFDGDHYRDQVKGRLDGCGRRFSGRRRYPCRRSWNRQCLRPRRNGPFPGRRCAGQPFSGCYFVSVECNITCLEVVQKLRCGDRGRNHQCGVPADRSTFLRDRTLRGLSFLLQNHPRGSSGAYPILAVPGSRFRIGNVI